MFINHLNAELNPICHLLALLGTHPILHVSRIRVKALLIFHSSVVEDSNPLGYDTMSEGNQFLTFDTLLYNYK
jgi:hypothetical protein